MSKPVPFTEIIKALLDSDRPFPPKYLHQFSDISPENLALLQDSWQNIYTERRRALLEDLEQIVEVDTRVCFDDLSRMALKDVDASVRAIAIRLLWECEDIDLAPVFIQMMEHDPEVVVRSSAASALGLYVYLGELEEISNEIAVSIEDNLLKTLKGNDDVNVRRHALESLGYSSRPEIPLLIKHAYNKNEKDWTISALFAMGRSLDKRWEKFVMSVLDDVDDDIQFEAVRAAGLLELPAARQPLIDLLMNDDNLDDAIRAAAIQSLSQIGGDGVKGILEYLLETAEDDEDEEFLEDALENLIFTEELDPFDMFDFDVRDEEDIESYKNKFDSIEEEDDDDDDNVTDN